MNHGTTSPKAGSGSACRSGPVTLSAVSRSPESAKGKGLSRSGDCEKQQRFAVERQTARSGFAALRMTRKGEYENRLS
jgi:hypothetical protein